MSGLRLRETFNSLLNNQFTKFLKKGAASLAVAGSLIMTSMPAVADHNPHGDLDTRNSDTTQSQELRSIQQEFNEAVKDRRLILMDRDWIELNRSLEQNPQDRETLSRILSEYFAQRGNIHLNTDFFDLVSEGDLTSPHTRRFTISNDAGQTAEVCMVFGGQGNQEINDRIRDFIDVSRAIHGDAFYDAALTNLPSLGDFTDFVTYHEMGHCMDDFFLKNMGNAKSSSEYLALYHRAESFADTFGVLMMAREQGVTDIADSIANTRLANMALAGPFQIAWGDPNSPSYYASYIYATHRSVDAAQNYIDQHGVAALQAMSFHEVAALAGKIVEQNALNGHEADALMYLFASKHNMDTWTQLKDQIPFINERYDEALELRREMDEGLRGILDIRQIPGNALDHLSFTGNPGAYIRELQSKVDKNAMHQNAVALGERLYQAAGGANADIDALVKAFTAQKDQWRSDLDSADEAVRDQANKNLAVSGEALWRASQLVQGLDPDAKPEPEPAPESANDNETDVANIIAPHVHQHFSP